MCCEEGKTFVDFEKLDVAETCDIATLVCETIGLLVCTPFICW
jgi:hypothetical protein